MIDIIIYCVIIILTMSIVYIVSQVAYWKGYRNGATDVLEQWRRHNEEFGVDDGA